MNMKNKSPTHYYEPYPGLVKDIEVIGEIKTIPDFFACREIITDKIVHLDRNSIKLKKYEQHSKH